MIGGINSSANSMNISAMMQQRMDQKFAADDIDGSGALDKSEFQAVVESINEKTGQNLSVDEVFAEFDADGDGMITKEEMQNMLPKGPPPPMMEGMSPEASGLSSILDILNNSSEDSISTDSLDTNGDGVVDSQEISEKLMQMKMDHANTLLSVFSDNDSSNGSSLNLLG